MLQFVLFLFHIRSKCWIKSIQMCIQTYKPVGMPDINGLTEAKRFNLNPVYITIRGSIHREVFAMGCSVR